MAAKKKTEELIHDLIPKHEKVSDKDKEALFKKYHVTPREIPKILISDPAIRHLDTKEGDLIKITRKSYTSGETTFYRCVVSE